MSIPILVAYATRYGSTEEMANEVAVTLREQGLAVIVQPMRDVPSLEGYSAVVLGAALYMGHWHNDMRRFLLRHRKALTELPAAIFTLGPTQPDAKAWQDSRAQLDQELARFPWLTPVALELFGGIFDPKKLRFPWNFMLKNIPMSDARDRAAIRAWARSLVERLQPAVAH